MKKYGLTMMAGVAALAIASSASAQTVTVHIGGSTACRAFVSDAIVNLLGGSSASTWSMAYQGTNPQKGYQQEFVGTTTNGVLVHIHTSWAGSVGGIASLATNNTVETGVWMASTNLVANGNGGVFYPANFGGGNQGYDITTATPTADPNVAPSEDAQVADLAMSDSFTGATPYKNLNITGAGDTKVAVLPFAWIRTPDSTNALANMTPQLAKDILTAGYVPLSQFTGNSADSNNYVICVGRDADSGTRVAAFAECGFGVYGLPKQWQVTASGGIVSAIQLYPAQTINGVDYTAGQGGYAAGSGLKSAVNATGAAAVTVALPGKGSKTGCYTVGYVGGTDISGVTQMTWNGFAYGGGTNAASIAEGQYSFWCYEHLMYITGLSATKVPIAQQIASGLKATSTQNGFINISDMHVVRTVDGGVVTR